MVTAPTPRVSSAIERSKLHDAVVEHYETEIFTGQLAVGARLPSEAEIARLFAVSTRTIRDALQVLETKGLVQRRHGECALVVRNDVAGYLGSLALTVKQLFSTDPKYFVELMDVRRMIELDVVGHLCTPIGTVNAEVERALAGMHDAAESQDPTKFSQFDAAFHLGLVHSTANKVLHILYDNLFALIAEVIQVTSRVPRKSLHTAYAEHANIHARIQDKDATAARTAMGQHIEGSTRYLEIALAGSSVQARAPSAGTRRVRSGRRAVA